MKDWKFVSLILLLIAIQFYFVLGFTEALVAVVFMTYEYFNCYYPYNYCLECTEYDDASRVYTIKINGVKYE